MEEAGLTAGDAVLVRSAGARRIPARIRAGGEELRGKRRILADRFFRKTLRVYLGDNVEVEKLDPQPITRIVVAPSVDIFGAHGLGDHIHRSLAAEKALAGLDSLLYVRFPNSVAGTRYMVEEIEPGPGYVDESTQFVLRISDAAKVADESMEVSFDDVGGLHREVAMVRELVELPLRYPFAYQQVGINPPRGIILYGPPGVGKTHLARAIASEVRAQFFYINGPEIVGTSYGETESNLRRIFGEAAHHAPSIVFIDELDAIAPKRGEVGTQTDARMVAQFLALMDGLSRVDGVMIIGTTNRPDALDAAFRRPGRFDREIPIMPPDVRGRREILKIHTREMPLTPEATTYLDDVAAATHGFVGADMMELCREAGLSAVRRTLGGDVSGVIMDDFEAPNVEKQDFEHAVSRVKPSGMREALIGIPDVPWTSIGGLDEAKRRLYELVELPLTNPSVFSSTGMQPPRGILLYGPSGTGKTLVARALAGRCEANFISVNGPEIFSKWLGESEETVRHIFHLGQQLSPAIIFFDQLDAIVPRRGSDVGTRTSERVVNQILSELDGLQPLSRVIVIAATNRVDLVDPSILRPGRLGMHLYFPMPDQASREEVLRIHIPDLSLIPGGDELVRGLAERTDGLSGADLQMLCWEAKLIALREGGYAAGVPLRREHFDQALVNVARNAQSLERLVAG
jgi:transitional endoplasmic reticulum ATPase